MNSTVTRGRGEMVVTATGMATEVGQISGMLSGVQQEKTPLTRQLDQLTVLITIMAAAALGLVIVFGLINGDDFDELFIIGISLAIAAIPTGPPRGRDDDALARHAGARGEGRDRQAAALGRDARLDVGDLLGQDRHADAEPDDGAAARGRRPALLGRGRGLLDRGQDPARRRRLGHARSSRSCCRWRSPTTRRCATARSWATRPRPRSSCSPPRAGSTSTRRGASYPRVAEVPFDSEYKLMATFHEMDGARPLLRQGRARRPARALVADPRRRRRDGPDGRAAGTRCWPRTTGSRAKGCACSPSPRATSTRPRSIATACCSTRCRA